MYIVYNVYYTLGFILEPLSVFRLNFWIAVFYRTTCHGRRWVAGGISIRGYSLALFAAGLEFYPRVGHENNSVNDFYVAIEYITLALILGSARRVAGVANIPVHSAS